MELFAVFSRVLLILAAIGGAASVVALAAVLVSDEAWARWKNARRGSRAAFALAVVLAALYGGTKSAGTRVNYPRTDSGTAYLTDAGSSVTNDAVTLNFTRSSLVPDDAWLFLDACPLSVTNSGEVAANCVTVYSNQFSAISLPLTVAYENATNYVWYAYTDWTPGPVVHTNGVVNVAWLKAKGEMPPNAVRVVPLRTEVNPINARPYLSYVQDGLVALFDGEWNTANGHDPTATVWADLTGNGHDLTMPDVSIARWQDNRAEFGYDGVNGGYASGPLPAEVGQGKDVTVELVGCADVVGNNASARNFILANIGISWRNANSAAGVLVAACIGGYSRCIFEYEFDSVATAAKCPNTLSASATTKTASEFYSSVAVYCNANRRYRTTGTWEGSSSFTDLIRVGANKPSLDGMTTVWSVRVYSRRLTAEEVAHNYEIDKRRFGSGLGAAK